jgi:alkanesulfonate monooxygenase SsuD/methylene tetrahydromethanopterin reductase-like flavin-dependent oxidoreductase (luciferase family)
MMYDVEFNSSVAYPARDVVELATVAEAVGFSAFWEGEANNMEPMVLLSAIAARTTTLQLGTAICHVYGRSPATLATQVATLNDYSDGRVLLGLGASNPRIAGWHGATFGAPLQRMREYATIVRELQTGTRSSVEGAFYSSADFKLAWKPQHSEIEVFIAALGPKMTELAGEISNGAVLNMTDPALVRSIKKNVERGAARAGKDPAKVDIVTKVRCTVNKDLDVARQPLKKVLTFYSLAEYYRQMISGMGLEREIEAIHAAYRSGGFEEAMKVIPDAMLDKLPLLAATSAEEVRERVAPYEEAGSTRIVVTYVPALDDLFSEVKDFLTSWERSAP